MGKINFLILLFAAVLCCNSCKLYKVSYSTTDSDRQPVGGCDFIFLDIDGPLAVLGDLAFETNISVVIGQLTQACLVTHVICQFLGKQRT